MKNREQIGVGNFKEVYVDPEDSSKVDVEFREQISPNQIKSAYYINKIAKIFFPENIPNVHMAGNKEISYMKTERVGHDPEHSRTSRLLIEHDDYFMDKSDQPIAVQIDNEIGDQIKNREEDPRVKKFIKDAYAKGFHIDSAGQNFVITADGKVKYLDLNPAWFIYQGNIELNYNSDALKTAIAELPQEKRKQAEQYLERINVLLEADNRSK